jgi:hypothetical protein
LSNVKKRVLSSAQAIAAAVDRADVVVLLGLLLIGLGFWDVSRPVALGVPGAVLVWFGLPTRPRFIADTKASRRRT